jgi:hypothetical protein
MVGKKEKYMEAGRESSSRPWTVGSGQSAVGSEPWGPGDAGRHCDGFVI